MRNLLILFFLISITLEFFPRHNGEIVFKSIKKKFKVGKKGRKAVFKKDQLTNSYIPIKKTLRKNHLHQRTIPVSSFYGVAPKGINFGKHISKKSMKKKELKI
jgi:hypothetical protein